MKILDLAAAKNLANSKSGNLENLGVAFTGDLKTNNDETLATTTQTARRMFGDKKDKSQKPEKERDLKNCRGYIIKILGLKDYSTRELQNKALKLGYKVEDIQAILDQLVKDNWINDERLAQNLIECYNGRKGKAWLQQKLNMRQIQKDIIVKMLSEVEIVPSENLKKQVEAKYKIKFGEYIEPNVKQKIAAFLAGRGFGNVFGVIKSWEDGEG